MPASRPWDSGPQDTSPRLRRAAQGPERLSEESLRRLAGENRRAPNRRILFPTEIGLETGCGSDVTRALVYLLMTGSLAAAVFQGGGVDPKRWEWSALGISVAAALSLSAIARSGRAPDNKWLFAALSALIVWMMLQLVPLPPAFIRRLSPEHWNAITAARLLGGRDLNQWAALSLAPAATWQRLLDVLPAAAAFVAAREMGWWWRNRLWIAIVPVIGIAWLESALGLVQFYLMRTAGEAGSVFGTYANRDHFAGLLEMAFPVAMLWAIAAWRKSVAAPDQRIGPALAAAVLLSVAACLLMGIIVSLSRMGFVSTLIAAGFSAGALLFRRVKYAVGLRRRWQWVGALAVPLLIATFLPTRELVLRFADLAATEEISRDDRIQIWQDTSKVIAAYAWTGTGLGAYERGLYRYKRVAPTRTVDFAHNDYLQVLAEVGIAGSIPIAIFVVAIFSPLVSSVFRQRRWRNWEWSAGLLGALLAMAVHSLADFNLYIPANALVFAWLSGLAASPGLYQVCDS